MAGVALLMLLAGCGAVDVEATEARGAERTACRELVAGLPSQVAGQSARETSDDAVGAAWGDPAIVLRCGVGTPEGYELFSACQRVAGVDWYAPEDQIADQGSEVVLTTIGRSPAVELTVPAELRPPDDVLVDVAPALRAGSRVTEPCQ